MVKDPGQLNPHWAIHLSGGVQFTFCSLTISLFWTGYPPSYYMYLMELSFLTLMQKVITSPLEAPQYYELCLLLCAMEHQSLPLLCLVTVPQLLYSNHCSKPRLSMFLSCTNDRKHVAFVFLYLFISVNIMDLQFYPSCFKCWDLIPSIVK